MVKTITTGTVILNDIFLGNAKNGRKKVYSRIHVGQHYCYIHVMARSCFLVLEVNFFLLPFSKFHNSWFGNFFSLSDENCNG